MVYRVGANGSPTKSGEWKVETKDEPTSNGKSGVGARGKITKSKSNADCYVICLGQQIRTVAPTTTTNSEG